MNRSQLRISAIALVAAALTIGPALLHGRYQNRWGAPPDLARAAVNLAQIPDHFGAWRQTEVGEPLSDYVCRELGLSGYESRTYVDDQNNAEVKMLVMVGQPGPLVRHPPTVCYTNQANQQIGEVELVETRCDANTEGAVCAYRLVRYQRENSPVGQQFLVAYSHTVDGVWSAPDSPRLTFGGSPYLYKVQMLTEAGPLAEQAADVAEANLRRFATDFFTAFKSNRDP